MVKPLNINRYGSFCSKSGVKLPKNRSEFIEDFTQNSYHWSDTIRIRRKVKVEDSRLCIKMYVEVKYSEVNSY